MVAGQLADESSNDQGAASAGSNSEWRPLAVTNIAEADIRNSIPEGVDFVMAINGQSLPDASLERVFIV